MSMENEKYLCHGCGLKEFNKVAIVNGRQYCFICKQIFNIVDDIQTMINPMSGNASMKKVFDVISNVSEINEIVDAHQLAEIHEKARPYIKGYFAEIVSEGEEIGVKILGNYNFDEPVVITFCPESW